MASWSAYLIGRDCPVMSSDIGAISAAVLAGRGPDCRAAGRPAWPPPCARAAVASDRTAAITKNFFMRMFLFDVRLPCLADVHGDLPADGGITRVEGIGTVPAGGEPHRWCPIQEVQRDEG